MSLLLLTLPPGPPGSYTYATSVDGQTLAAHGSASAALLPTASRGVEVVAVVPASQLSWQRVTLPPGVGPGSARLRTVLVGMLEEQLLDDPEQLHFALSPDARSGSAVWVAVCPKAWLTAHVHALDEAQRPISRIVPELHPRTGPLQLTVVGEADQPQALMSGDGVPGGAQALPLTAQTLALLQTTEDHPNSPDNAFSEVIAEPAVAEVTEQLLRQPVIIQPAAQRLLASSRSNWDLAQLDLARTGTARAAKRMATVWRDFLHAPLWRPARWGIVLLLLANLVGLNLWAWRAQQDLVARRTHINAALTSTFPQVQVVVDGPVQMQRQLAALRQATGAASPRDLEPMLSALGQALEGPATPNQIDYSAGELRLKGIQLATGPLATTNQRLQAQGYQLHTEADSMVLRERALP
ncbi:type II secretion system protein GspL [Ottowia sp.]|uniref:type II secretion system protein GspL n=1 Tax=Ottowia sp. TaxID=1898956 RepID=UPI003A8675EE